MGTACREVWGSATGCGGATQQVRGGECRGLPAAPATVAAYLAHLADPGLKASPGAGRRSPVRKLKGWSSHVYRCRPARPRRDPWEAATGKAPASAKAIAVEFAHGPDALIGRETGQSSSSASRPRCAETSFGAASRAVVRLDREGRAHPAGVAEIMKCCAAAAGLDPAIVSGHSLRLGFVTSALEHGADIFKVMDHRRVETIKGCDRRDKAFRDNAREGFLRRDVRASSGPNATRG
jgi:hypothetical protein